MALVTAQSTVWGVCCMVYSLHCMFTAHWSSVNTVQSLYEKRAVELCDRWRIRSAYHKWSWIWLQSWRSWCWWWGWWKWEWETSTKQNICLKKRSILHLDSVIILFAFIKTTSFWHCICIGDLWINSVFSLEKRKLVILSNDCLWRQAADDRRIQAREISTPLCKTMHHYAFHSLHHAPPWTKCSPIHYAPRWTPSTTMLTMQSTLCTTMHFIHSTMHHYGENAVQSTIHHSGLHLPLCTNILSTKHILTKTPHSLPQSTKISLRHH